tara:strand:+ start:5360 stop:5557 length:198 start_codon:yes stop_codon:yes gene_type:complete
MFEEVIANLPNRIFTEFRWALSSGHWSCGTKLTTRQRKTCEEALLVRTKILPNLHPMMLSPTTIH